MLFLVCAYTAVYTRGCLVSICKWQGDDDSTDVKFCKARVRGRLRSRRGR